MTIHYVTEPSPAMLREAADLINSSGQLSRPINAGHLQNCIRTVCAMNAETGEIVGTGSIKPSPVDGAAEVGYLFVKPEYRQHGVAKRLLEARIRIAAGLGYHTLYATTLKSNGATARLLTGHHFHLYGDFISAHGTGNVISWYFLTLRMCKASVDASATLTHGLKPFVAKPKAKAPAATVAVVREIPFPLP